MSKAAFPVNDLLRRRLQTSLSIATLTFSVASTLFFLLFSCQLTGLTSANNVFTIGISSLFSQFILFIGVLIFAVGVVLASFIGFFMMTQRTRDFGLLKAIGCPNSLVGGYFMTELLTTTLAGCGFGVILGFLMDYGVANFTFSEYKLPNFWFVPVVFLVFFILSLIFGLIPILKASKMSPVTAISPVTYHGLIVTEKHQVLSKSGLTWKIANRSLLRRQSATFRIVILMSLVFILLTVCVAGGVIAGGTTSSWIQNSVGKNTFVIATNSMGNQYEQLLSTFSGGKVPGNFNYSNSNLAIPSNVVSQLTTLPSVSLVDSRLVLDGQIQEVANFSFGETSGETGYVGGDRTGESLIIGVNPSQLSGSWNIQGSFLNGNGTGYEAVIGDSISLSMYSVDPKLNINQANPLSEGLSFNNQVFNIVGVCVDPLNNGFVTYMPINTLENLTGIENPNLLFVTINTSANPSIAETQIKNLIQSIDPNLNVFSLNPTVQKNTNLLGSTWESIMLMPLFTIVSAAFCMISYMILATDEQHQELSVLRAIGAKPRFVVLVLAIQSTVLLLSSFGIGISLGFIITVLILMPQPIITGLTVLEITGFLGAALAGIMVFSLYPAFRLARASILKSLS